MTEQTVLGALYGIIIVIVGILGKIAIQRVKGEKGSIRMDCLEKFSSIGRTVSEGSVKIKEHDEKFQTINSSLAAGTQRFLDSDRRLLAVEAKDDKVLDALQKLSDNLTTQIMSIGERIARLEGR